jgi:hypothetical protein
LLTPCILRQVRESMRPAGWRLFVSTHEWSGPVTAAAEQFAATYSSDTTKAVLQVESGQIPGVQLNYEPQLFA